MKQWKLVLVALLSLLLVCACMSAVAEDCTHQNVDGTSACSWSTTKDATCLVEGSMAYKCDLCEKVIRTQAIAKLNHDVVGVSYTVKTPASCAAAGVEGQLCKLGCGTYLNTKAIPKLVGDSVHTWVMIKEGYKATCTVDGMTDYLQCTVCQTYKGGVTIKAPGHKATGVWVNDPERTATCTKGGYMIQYCLNCDAIALEKVQSPLNHSFQGEWTVQKAPTCTVPGTQTQKCIRCDVTTSKPIAALGHDIVGVGYTLTKEPTCGAAGEEARICLREGCGAKLEARAIPATGKHDMVVIDNAVEATCLSTGKTEKTQCRVCTLTVGGAVIPKLAHKSTDWIDDPKATATCTKAGRLIKICQVCNTELDAKTKSPLGHKLGEAVVVKPTCTATGTSTKTCERCDYKEVTKLAMIPHDVTGVAWTVKTPATCAVPGVEERICTVCKNSGETRAIAKTPCIVENLVQIDAAIEMTCEKDGKTATMQCPTCKAITGGKVIKATGHKTLDQVITEPTCTADGVKTVLCTNAWCNKADKVVAANVKIPAKGHQGVWQVLEKATPEKNGISIKVCKVCKFEIDRKTVKYTEMLYNNTITSFGPCTRDLVGGDDWYRVTPIDLTVEGTFTYPLVASNKYTVGTATVVIANGALTVTYDLNAAQIMVNSEALIIYPNLAALKNPTPATAGTYTFGAPIDIAATFGEDTKVIISVFLKADYNEIGAGVYGFKADQAQIDAMKAIID